VDGIRLDTIGPKGQTKFSSQQSSAQQSQQEADPQKEALTLETDPRSGD
jgi:hypothetical protein